MKNSEELKKTILSYNKIIYSLTNILNPNQSRMLDHTFREIKKLKNKGYYKKPDSHDL